MGLIKDKLQGMINDTNMQKYNDTIAEITSYDSIRNTASIRFVNSNNGSVINADNVQIKANEGGLTQAAPEIGQNCLVTFIGGNLLCPVITSIYNNDYYNGTYSKKTNSDQGAYIINSNINDIDIDSIEITPMLNDYFNDVGIGRYRIITKDFTDTDAIQEVRYLLMTLDKYKTTEEGITNMKTKSTIKFKDNGDIDIFVDNNTGIRISPETKSINIYGTFKINGKTVDFKGE